MNIQFLLFHMMFYIDVHVTYSIYPFIHTNLFIMESIVLPIKPFMDNSPHLNGDLNYQIYCKIYIQKS